VPDPTFCVMLCRSRGRVRFEQRKRKLCDPALCEHLPVTNVFGNPDSLRQRRLNSGVCCSGGCGSNVILEHKAKTQSLPNLGPGCDLETLGPTLSALLRMLTAVASPVWRAIAASGAGEFPRCIKSFLNLRPAVLFGTYLRWTGPDIRAGRLGCRLQCLIVLGRINRFPNDVVVDLFGRLRLRWLGRGYNGRWHRFRLLRGWHRRS
jgi:hypothetical protein